MADIEAYIKEEEDAFYDEIVDSLRTTGRKLVDKARAKTAAEHGFNNITWNLRSSIGMCIVDENGLIQETYFPPIGKGEHGNEVGKELAERLALYAREVNEMAMIFVAGEDYASFVQAKGKDVINNVIGDNLEPELNKILRP
ncbi:MAG: hypothetical protein ABIN91_11240 [Mucilaginibacter sp.]|uniref:hypothetical protein n=1 Tax=Mucilaginibacter sp. TaxID=1882438 RepID=UPI0032652277